MDNKITQQAAESLKKQKKRKQYLGVLACLAVLVTIGTVLSFKYTGQAMNKKVKVLDCQLEVHHHEASCYNEKNELICGLADYVVHTHNEDCYDEDGNLVCKLPEIQEHKHTAQCYAPQSTLVCTQEESNGHVHTDACYEARVSGPICGVEEHAHSETCYDADGNLICGMEEHTHGDACYTTENVLVCGVEEGSGAHHHDASCFEEKNVLTCGHLELHKHDKNLCYDADGNLTCKETVLEEHVHTDACFKEMTIEEAEAAKEQSEGVGALNQRAETENYIVEVSYNEDAELPENAKLTVVEYALDSAEYAEAVQKLGYEPEWLLDISFMDGDTEVEPKANVNVNVINKNKSDVSNYDIVHFADDDAMEDISGTGIQTNDGTGAAFSMDSFSQVAGSPSTLAANDYTVAVGKTLKLTGTKNTYHQWTSSNNSVATVSGSTSSATVTGKKAGTVTITHKYRGSSFSQWNTENFNVTVGSSAPVVTPPAVDIDGKTSSIVLQYIGDPSGTYGDRFDAGTQWGENIMKYSIVLVNTDGTVSYSLPEGSVVPERYTYNGTRMNVSAALNDMGLSIPGYTLQNGYAFFWWSGNYTGTMFKVPTIMNNKVISKNYPGYKSYLAFEGLRGDVNGTGTAADYDAYMNATFQTSSTGNDYAAGSGLTGYAYNPTGTLRIVFFQVSDRASYKTKFVDAFRDEDESAFSVIDEINMMMSRGSWTQGTTTYDWTGNADTITTKTPAARPGYEFDGWYTEKDEYGNGTGIKVTYVDGEKVTVKDSDGRDTQINKTTDPHETGNVADKIYYAKWLPKKKTTTVEKIWDDGNNANNSRPERVTFTITANGPQGGVDGPVNLTAEDVAVEKDVTVEDGKVKVTLSASNNWKKDVSLPETVIAIDEGATLSYTVTEEPIEPKGSVAHSQYVYTPSETAYNPGTKTYAITNTGNLKEDIHFYLNLKSQILNYDGSSQISQATDKFTTSLFESKLLLPKDYKHTGGVDHSNHYGGSESVVIQSASSVTAFDVDQQIRTIGVGNGYSDGKYTYVMEDVFPTDEEIFATIRANWNTVTKGKGLSVNDATVQDPSILTTENFECRWYVLKDTCGDAWHVDGVLVPRTATLTVTKTFDNEAQAAAAKAAEFVINAEGTFDEAVTLSQNLPLDDNLKVVNADGSVTYTWSFEAVETTYTLTEVNYDKLGGFIYKSTENTVTQKNGATWETTPGESTSVDIACLKKATDDTAGEKQKVTFANHYASKIKVLKVSDQNREVSLAGAKFTLANNEGSSETLTSDENGVIFAGEIADGQYLLTETEAPAGYLKMKTPVTITVNKGLVTASIVGSTSGAGTDLNDDGSYVIDADNCIVIRVTNTKGTELPSTGGSGTLPYTFAGLTLIGIGLMYVLLIRKRRNV